MLFQWQHFSLCKITNPIIVSLIKPKKHLIYFNLNKIHDFVLSMDLFTRYKEFNISFWFKKNDYFAINGISTTLCHKIQCDRFSLYVLREINDVQKSSRTRTSSRLINYSQVTPLCVYVIASTWNSSLVSFICVIIVTII